MNCLTSGVCSLLGGLFWYTVSCLAYSIGWGIVGGSTLFIAFCGGLFALVLIPCGVVNKIMGGYKHE